MRTSSLGGAREPAQRRGKAAVELDSDSSDSPAGTHRGQRVKGVRPVRPARGARVVGREAREGGNRNARRAPQGGGPRQAVPAWQLSVLVLSVAMFLRMAWRARGVHARLEQLKRVKERLVLAELRRRPPDRTTSEELDRLLTR